MKRFLSLNILLFTFLASFSQPNYDSLYSAAANLKGQERLDAYYYFYLNHYREHDSAEKLCDLFDRYAKEAKNQQNTRDEAYARYEYCTTLYKFQLFDRFLEELPKVLDFLKENKSMGLYYKLFYIGNECYVMKGKYQTAIMKAKDLYDEVKSTEDYYGLGTATYSLGFTYASLKNYDLAESYLREATAFFEKMPIKSGGASLCDAYNRLANVLLAEKKYNEIITTCKKGKDMTTKYLQEAGLESDSTYSLLFLNINIAYAYIGLNQLDKAESCIKMLKQEEHISNNNYMILNIYSLESKYYQASGDYDKAIEMMRKVIEYQEMIGPDNIILFERKKELSELLFAIGDYREAYTLI